MWLGGALSGSTGVNLAARGECAVSWAMRCVCGGARRRAAVARAVLVVDEAEQEWDGVGPTFLEEVGEKFSER